MKSTWVALLALIISLEPGLSLAQGGSNPASSGGVAGIVAGSNVALSPASPCTTGSCTILVTSATGLTGPISTSDNAAGSLNIGLATSGLSVATISSNTALALPQPIFGSLLQLTAADGVATNADLVAFGVAPGALFSLYSAAGTGAAPTASTGTVAAARTQYGGYDGSAWAVGASVNTVFAASASTWTTGDHGMRMALNITPSGTTTNETIIALDAATNSVAIGGTIGAESLRVLSVASAVDRIQISGGVSASNAVTLAALGTDTNIGIVLSPQGTGLIKFANTASFSANAAVATLLGSLGPTGSHTTVQTWLTFVDSTGATRYVPCF